MLLLTSYSFSVVKGQSRSLPGCHRSERSNLCSFCQGWL